MIYNLIYLRIIIIIIYMSDNELECIICNIITKSKYDYERHCKTKGHILHEVENTGFELTKELIMELFKYYCEKCNYYTNDDLSWNTHTDGNKHLMSNKEHKKFIKESTKYSIDKGDNLEEYFVKLYKECKDIEDVQRIGQLGGKYDIKIKYQDENYYRGIQCKTIKIKPDEYRIGVGTAKYKDDTLIICSDDKRNFFIMFPYNVIKHLKSNNVSVKYEQGMKYYPYCYPTLDQFKVELFKLSKTSTIMKNETDSLTIYQKSEYDMLKRLNIKSENYGLKYEDRKSNGNKYDCIINNKKIQCKTSISIDKHLYIFALTKSGGNNKPRIPYNENDDIDYFIFEIAIDKYFNYFYIIPKSKLIELEYINTDKCKGKVSVGLAPFDYKEYRKSLTHWSLEYINRFDLLDNKIKSQQFNLKNLDKILEEHQLEYKKIKTAPNQPLKIGSIMNKKITFRTATAEKRKNVYSISVDYIENKQRFPIKKGMYDFIIVELIKYKGNYYIFPEHILIKHGVISTSDKSGKRKFELLDPTIKKNNWSLEYLNKFDQFRT